MGCMRVSVLGLGYVGCVTAVSLARAGHQVVAVDINGDKVAMVNEGRSPIVEPELAEHLKATVRAGRLQATTSNDAAMAASDLALICVGTPSCSNGQLDVEALRRVGEGIGRALVGRQQPYSVVLRSTVLPGTTEQVLVPALRAGGASIGAGVRIAVNPEFMREGSAVLDVVAPPFTLVGAEDSETADLLRSLYEWVEAPFVHTSVRTAEMVKYASNAFHALKICFANEMGDLAETLGADAQEVLRIFRMDRTLNISEAYLKPGFAFGGSCLPKDLRALLYAGRRADLALPLLSSVLPSNDEQVRRAILAVLEKKKRRVGVVGLAFKPGTDDLRESPMVTLVETLIGKGCDVRILDRSVSIARLVGANRRYIEEEIPHIASLMCDEPAELLEHAEVVVLTNAGAEAAAVLGSAAPRHTIIDLTRGILCVGEAVGTRGRPAG
jgi:GDP-mannose 6-dehydrogenase